MEDKLLFIRAGNDYGNRCIRGYFSCLDGSYAPKNKPREMTIAISKPLLQQIIFGCL